MYVVLEENLLSSPTVHAVWGELSLKRLVFHAAAEGLKYDHLSWLLNGLLCRPMKL